MKAHRQGAAEVNRKCTRVRRAALALAFAIRGARAGQDTGREIAKLRRLFLAAVA